MRICRATARRDEDLPRALIPGGPYNTSCQREALRRLAEDVATRGIDAEGGRYRVLREILRRELPRTSARAPGAPLQEAGFELEEAKRIVAGLDGSHLFVQGPPGSGKTYNGAHLVLHLLGRGARVGVAAGTHRAIHGLLERIEELAPEAGVAFRGLKKGSARDGTAFESKLDHPYVESSEEIADFLDPACGLLAGTAWLFAREELDGTLDYLFIDEAGQISLADALAMGTAARNVVLLGDPLQIAQVSQAIHPPGAGASVLEHLLGEHATIPPERGLFIDQTRRMHPDVCGFVSEVVYEGRLASWPGCEGQRIDAPAEPTGTGVRWIPVEHAGSTRHSPEEAEAIAARVERLLAGGSHTKASGETAPLRPEDVMVVAPYNAQVRCLREHLPAGVAVGTVDRFQGQEAAVVFFSMATSSGEEIPRNVEFLFSRNRLNVAVSRARCLAVLVCSPELLRIRCRSAEQMRLVNALCRLVEVAEGGRYG